MTDEARETTRRELLARGAAWGAGVGVAGHAIAWAASLSPRVLYEPSKRRTLPAPEHFPEGVTFLADLRLFVVREGTVLRALSATPPAPAVSRDGAALSPDLP